MMGDVDERSSMMGEVSLEIKLHESYLFKVLGFFQVNKSIVFGHNRKLARNLCKIPFACDSKVSHHLCLKSILGTSENCFNFWQ